MSKQIDHSEQVVMQINMSPQPCNWAAAKMKHN